RLVESGICEACKRRSDINPKNVLIAAALIVYIGVNVAAYIKDHPPRELTAEQRRGHSGSGQSDQFVAKVEHHFLSLFGYATVRQNND
ncbi:hypothetical protein QVM62_31620, partial [Pseudomonas putida]|uniref:hypothetical protein n=1 Tax=Pseudomonas putida TaxID=303 RepID=UPI0035242D2E